MYLDKCHDKNNNKYNNENNNKCTNKIIQNFIIIFQLLKKINATRTTRFLNKHFKKQYIYPIDIPSIPNSQTQIRFSQLLSNGVIM